MVISTVDKAEIYESPKVNGPKDNNVNKDQETEEPDDPSTPDLGESLNSSVGINPWLEAQATVVLTRVEAGRCVDLHMTTNVEFTQMGPVYTQFRLPVLPYHPSATTITAQWDDLEQVFRSLGGDIAIHLSNSTYRWFF